MERLLASGFFLKPWRENLKQRQAVVSLQEEVQFLVRVLYESLHPDVSFTGLLVYIV